MKVTVILNGGPDNPWHAMGLRCNPFPQIAKHEFAAADRTGHARIYDPLSHGVPRQGAMRE